MIESIKMVKSDFMWHVVYTRKNGVSGCVAVDTAKEALQFINGILSGPWPTEKGAQHVTR